MWTFSSLKPSYSLNCLRSPNMILIGVLALTLFVVYYINRWYKVWQFSEQFPGQPTHPLIGNGHLLGNSSYGMYLLLKCKICISGQHVNENLLRFRVSAVFACWSVKKQIWGVSCLGRPDSLRVSYKCRRLWSINISIYVWYKI